MADTKTYTLEQLDELLNDCCEYAENEADQSSAEAYKKELNTLMMEKFTEPNVIVWHHLIGTGIFHDAIGKVKESDSEQVTVYTVY